MWGSIVRVDESHLHGTTNSLVSLSIYRSTEKVFPKRKTPIQRN
jgi:hypothetical protein